MLDSGLQQRSALQDGRAAPHCFPFPPSPLSYGAVPVVRHTGGLRDTVFDVDSDKGRAGWDVAGAVDWAAEGAGDCTNGFAFGARARVRGGGAIIWCAQSCAATPVSNICAVNPHPAA